MSTYTPTSLPTATHDPLAAVLDLGLQASRVGLLVGVLVALFGHSMAFAKPMLSLHDMFEGVQELRSELSDYYWATYDVDIAPPPDPPEPAAEKDQPAEPDPPDPADAEPVAPPPLAPPPPSDDTPAPPPPSQDPYDEPPAAAEAADVMTAPDDAVDLTGAGWDMVDKDGSKRTGGGMSSDTGTAKEPVYDPRASATGKPGATGTSKGPPPPPPPPAQDLSRSARPTNMGVLRGCPFPPQADVAQVDRATVTVTVKVSAAGAPLSAVAQGDPGYGFGAQARRCAMGASYQPALNRAGKAVTASVSLRFRFTR